MWLTYPLLSLFKDLHFCHVRIVILYFISLFFLVFLVFLVLSFHFCIKIFWDGIIHKFSFLHCDNTSQLILMARLTRKVKTSDWPKCGVKQKCNNPEAL